MTEKSPSGDVVLVNGRQRDLEVSYDSDRPKLRKMSGRRKQDGSGEGMGRRVSRGRQVAERLVAKISTAWRHPNSELTSAADDSGFASTGRRTVTSPHQATDDVCSSSTTVKSTSLTDWLDVDRVAVGRVPGAVGIINHNNTCFINAIIQCLSNTAAFAIHALDPAIRQRFHNHVSSTVPHDGQPIRPRLTTDGELGKELCRLLRAIWTGRYSTESSRAFHRAVRRLASGWYRGEEQNDAHEFAAWMLNRLRQEQFGATDLHDYSRYPAVDNTKQTVMMTCQTQSVVV